MIHFTLILKITQKKTGEVFARSEEISTVASKANIFHSRFARNIGSMRTRKIFDILPHLNCHYGSGSRPFGKTFYATEMVGFIQLERTTIARFLWLRKFQPARHRINIQFLALIACKFKLQAHALLLV